MSYLLWSLEVTLSGFRKRDENQSSKGRHLGKDIVAQKTSTGKGDHKTTKSQTNGNRNDSVGHSNSVHGVVGVSVQTLKTLVNLFPDVILWSSP